MNTSYIARSLAILWDRTSAMIYWKLILCVCTHCCNWVHQVCTLPYKSSWILPLCWCSSAHRESSFHHTHQYLWTKETMSRKKHWIEEFTLQTEVLCAITCPASLTITLITIIVERVASLAAASLLESGGVPQAVLVWSFVHSIQAHHVLAS